jgi:hypothetical protein
MTQRYMGSDLPFWPDFMRALRQELRRQQPAHG